MTSSTLMTSTRSPAMSGEWEEVSFIAGPADATWDQTNDGRHVLAVEPAGGEQVRLWWDGVAAQPFQLVPQADGNQFAWSPDATRVGYYGRRGDRLFVGIDGTEFEAEDITRSVPPTFSPDGSRVAFGIKTSAGWRLMVDGEVLGDWRPAPRPPVFSVDGTRLAFAAENFELQPGQRRTDYRQCIVLDGEAQPEGIGISSDPLGVQFSPDGRRFLYAQIVDGGGVRLVVDGAATEPFADIGFPTFSPDSRRVVYAAGPMDRFTFFDDGVRRGNTYWRIGPPVFSADSSRLAFIALRSKGHGVAVIDGIEGPEFADFWGDIEFSPDGRRVAYISMTKTGGFLSRSMAVTLMLDGSVGPAWDEVSAPPHFSPDSRRVAFPARRGKTWHMVVDGEPGPAFDMVGPARFSATGRLGHIAMTREGGAERYRVVVEGIDMPVMDDGSEVRPGESFLFSPDGEHVATVGRLGGAWRPVVDGQVGPGAFGAGGLRFEGDRAFALVSGPDGAHQFALRT